MWVHRESEKPPSTSVECYWRKPKLSKVGSSIKFITTSDFGVRSVEVQDGQSFVEDVLSASIINKTKSELISFYKDPDTLSDLDIYSILIRFKDDCGRDFFQYAQNIMSDELCTEASVKTMGQSKSPL